MQLAYSIFWIFAVLFRLVRCSIYPSCSICGRGRGVVNPNASAGVDGATCSELDASGKALLFSAGRCAFMQGFVKKRCCDPASQSSEPPAGPAHIMGSAEATKCYETVHSDTLFCMEELYIGFCLGELNDRPCASCYKRDFGLCGAYNTEGGYELDCSNVNATYKDMAICDHKLYLDFHVQKNSSKRPSTGGSSSGAVVYSPFILVVLLARIVRARNREYVPVESSIDRDVELPVVSQ